MFESIYKHCIVPKNFLIVSKYWVGLLYLSSLCILGYTFNDVFYHVPHDHKQGIVSHIMYIHVPVAILSLSIYISLSILSAIYWVWQIKMADVASVALAYIGFVTTCLTLITGAIWGKPTWGTWWLWDARMTSEAILLLLYAAFLIIRFILQPVSYAKRMAAIFATIGLIDVPLVHYSVEWWHTLHQGPSLSLFEKPKIAWVMLMPLGCAFIGVTMLTAGLVLHVMRIVVKYNHKIE